MDKDRVQYKGHEGSIQRRWPVRKNYLPTTVNPYIHVRDELLVQESLILCGDRVGNANALGRGTIQDLVNSANNEKI